MIASGGIPIRFNRERFGFIVGYPSGEIVLASHGAGPLLERGVPFEEIQPYLLDTFELRHDFHLDTPPLVWLELTKKCNLNCPHCYIHGGEARQDEMPSSRFFRLLDEFAEMGVWAVAITGGEPTMHPDFVSIVRYARSRSLLVGVATNGLFLTEELLKELPTDGVIISVSLDNLHLDGNRDTQVAQKAILRCIDKGFLTNIMTNSNSQNLSQLETMMNWAEANGVSIRSVPFSPLGRGKQNKHLENSVDDVETAASFWLRECEWEHEYHRKAGLCVGSIFNYGLSLAYMTRRCSSGRFLCYVCADGTVFPCTMCAGEEILSPGSVREQSFIELWRSPWEIRQYSWDRFTETCKGCSINDPRYYCSSRCPAMSHARHGRLFECGASDFEKLSVIVRTALLEQTPVGKESGGRQNPASASRLEPEREEEPFVILQGDL